MGCLGEERATHGAAAAATTVAAAEMRVAHTGAVGAMAAALPLAARRAAPRSRHLPTTWPGTVGGRPAKR